MGVEVMVENNILHNYHSLYYAPLTSMAKTYLVGFRQQELGK